MEGGLEAAVVVLQAAHGAVALQDFGRAVVLHAPVAAEHALLRAAVRTVPLTLGNLSKFCLAFVVVERNQERGVVGEGQITSQLHRKKPKTNRGVCVCATLHLIRNRIICLSVLCRKHAPLGCF